MAKEKINKMEGDFSAFPVVFGPEHVVKGGLTKREYFAAAAMQGILSSPIGYEMARSVLAETAVNYADLLIKALNE